MGKDLSEGDEGVQKAERKYAADRFAPEPRRYLQMVRRVRHDSTVSRSANAAVMGRNF